MIVKIIFINVRALLRAFTFLIGICGYFLSALMVYPYYKFRPMKGRAIICHILKFYAAFACWFMGIRVEVKRNQSNDNNDNYLIVSNHLSYTDILVLCSHYPACFVTSLEMKKTLFLGQICILGGCVFVDRKSKKNLSLEVLEITKALKEKLNVVIFPEATSTNGEEVIRFRRPLFKSAIDAQALIRPFSVNYRKIDNENVCLSNRDKVFWYGDMTFTDHLWGVFKIGSVEVELIEGEAVNSSLFQEPGDLALACHSIVQQSYTNIIN